MARFTRRVDKQNKTVTVTDNMTGESVTGRYHDSLGAKETGDAIEGNLVQKEARPRVSDETSTAMQTIQLQDQSGANKIAQEGFLSGLERYKSLNATKAQPEGESALTRASQGVSAVNNNDPGIMNIPDMPKQDVQMSTNLAMQKSRDQIPKPEQGPVPATALKRSNLGPDTPNPGNQRLPSMEELKRRAVLANQAAKEREENQKQKEVSTLLAEANDQESLQKALATEQGRGSFEDVLKPKKQSSGLMEEALMAKDKPLMTEVDLLTPKKVPTELAMEATEGSTGEWSYPVIDGRMHAIKREKNAPMIEEQMISTDEPSGLLEESTISGDDPVNFLTEDIVRTRTQDIDAAGGIDQARSPQSEDEAKFGQGAELQEMKLGRSTPAYRSIEETEVKFDAEKPVPKKIAQLPREEKTAAKEANGTHVRDESTGFTLNLSRLKKSFKRQEHFAMLKHIPQENRAAMLAEWGYIDPDELTVAQKKSALQLQKLENAKLQGAKYQIDLEQAQKNVGQSLTPVQEKQFSMLKDQYKEAAGRKPPNWVMMEEIGNELGKIHPSFKDKRNYKQMKKQYMENEKKELMKDGAVVKALSGIGVKGKDYYDTKERLYLSAEEKVKGASVEDLFKMNMPQKGGATTNLGNLLESQGFASWEAVDELQNNNPESNQLVGLRKALGLKEGSAITPQSYKGWAMDQFVNRSMTDIYGDTHLMVQQLTTEHIRALQDEVNNPNATEEETTAKIPKPKPEPNPKPEPKPNPKVVDTVEKNLPLIDQAFANELTRGGKEYQTKFLSFLRSPDNVIDAMKVGKKDLGSYMRKRRRAFNMDASAIDSLVSDSQAIVDFFRKNVEEYAKLPDEAKFYIAQEDQNLKAGRK